jgi:Uma2 family endonuclease
MHAISHKAFREWVTSPGFPEKARPTFIDGDAWVDMSPESIEAHSKVKGEFASTLIRLVRDRDLGEAYGDRAFFSNPRARISTEPDFMFVSWATSRARRVKLTPKKDEPDEFIELVGTPDIVLEVVSKSSVRKDLVRLRRAYYLAGIPEYWLVDARSPDVHFEILRRGRRDYEASAPAAAPQTSRVLRARFTLRRKRNRLGRYTYILDVAVARRR